jgi:CRISPR type III-A-associated RAMP protein Csm4
MNPGLVVKLRPNGPWRIGPDSGARNRVDVIYHSDSLYSAVTGAMARMGGLEEWLDATARAAAPAVCFSSCFPFLDCVGFVTPPRTMWPPDSPALLSANVRWKSARFVPLTVVQALLAGKALDSNRWSVDGASGCLIPAGKPGPFRTGVRWSAAVDRLTGATERHGTACIEFRAGAGLWTVTSFADDAARDRWLERVKAAFRLLADSGFGGERSRGWGRADAPEFTEGTLPELIVGAVGDESEPRLQKPAIVEPARGGESAQLEADPWREPLAAEAEPEAEPPAAEAGPLDPPDPGLPAPDPEPGYQQPPANEPDYYPPQPSPVPPMEAVPASGSPAYWLLSLYSPSAGDTVDWARGNYAVLARAGRVDSPAGTGELKKQLRMVAEGSVVYAGSAPAGAAPDVAPDGFAHPVFRAGFALAIPLPEGR